MKRNCEKLLSAKDGKRTIYIDSINKEIILKYINQDEPHQDKFRFITEIILGGLRNSKIYTKEEINEKSKGVTAMKFFKGQENDRIYCKEVKSKDGSYVVIAAVLYERKKAKSLSKKEISVIEKVASYYYEI